MVPKTNNGIMFAVTAIAITSIIAVVVLLIARPGDTNITLLFGFAGLIITNILQAKVTGDKVQAVVEKVAETSVKVDEAVSQVEVVHKTINSRMDELLDVTKVAAKAEGHAEGVLAEKVAQTELRPRPS